MKSNKNEEKINWFEQDGKIKYPTQKPLQKNSDMKKSC